MALFALTVAVLNFAIGFALAIVLGYVSSGQRSLVNANAPTENKQNATPSEPPTQQDSPNPSTLEVLSTETIPDLWRTAVEQSPIAPVSLAEAAVFFIQSRAATLADKLQPQEERSRQIDMLVGADPYREVASTIEEYMRDWTNELEESKAHLENTTETEQVSVLNETVINSIDEHLETVKSIVDATSSLDFDDDIFESGHQLIDRICELAKSLHHIRDESSVMFAEKLYMSTRPDADEPGTPSEQANLTDLIHVLNQWQKTEPSDGETRHLVLLDIVQFVNVNTQWGIGRGDRVLRDLGELLVELQSGMPDLLSFAQYRGTSFILCFVQSDDHATDKSVEQLQKAVEEHNFGSEERDLKLATGLSICEFVPDEPFDAMIEKLNARS